MIIPAIILKKNGWHTDMDAKAVQLGHFGAVAVNVSVAPQKTRVQIVLEAPTRLRQTLVSHMM